MTITVADMKDQLLTIDKLREELETTEPLTAHHISNTSQISFEFHDGWSEGLTKLSESAPVDVYMTVDGAERQMTRGALESAAKNHGLSRTYLTKLPDHFVKDLLDYHYSSDGLGQLEYSMLTINDRVSAFTRPSFTPYSNLDLLDSALHGIQSQYGENVEVLADYKRNNDLTKTDFRLIIPETERRIAGTGMDDIPENQDDVWSAGIHIANSAIGKKPTSVESYLFRWWCTNGATETASEFGRWDRRKVGGEDVYTWAETAVNEVLYGMEDRFNQIQALNAVDVSGNVAEVLREVYASYSVPLAQRNRVNDILLGSTVLTMYTVMQALTRAANEADLTPDLRDRLMRAGGGLPVTYFDSEKARIWREGHIARENAMNPYEIVIPQ